MKKKFIYGVLMAVAVAVSSIFFSCANNSGDSGEDELTLLSLSDIQGYTYKANFTASSGTQLTPVLIIYNDKRLDWNMNSNGMANNKYMYRASQTGQNKYISYWYSNATDWENNDTSKASMTVELGLNSMDEVVVLTSNAKVGAGSQMQGTRVAMRRTSTSKNTNAGTMSDITDTPITIPSGATSTNWDKANSFTGSFIYIVAGSGNDGTTGDRTVPTVKIEGNTGNKVKITTPKMQSPMNPSDIIQFVVENVDVKASSGVYYLSKDSFTTTSIGGGTNYNITGTSLKGKLDGGVLTLRVEFKPGTMPLNIVQIFKSSN